MDENELNRVYRVRFKQKCDNGKSDKSGIWQVLCKYFFQKFVQSTDVVCDIGAGYCEFINNISCQQKIAFDLNPNIKNYAGTDVIVINDNLSNINKRIKDYKIDLFFMSNFLEHLDSKEAIVNLFRELSKFPNSRIMILQPNIKYVGGKYWDFIDHKLPLTEKSIIEVGEMFGYKCTKCIKRFLPYTTKSHLPKFAWLVRLYLLLMPFSNNMFGEQSFLILDSHEQD